MGSSLPGNKSTASCTQHSRRTRGNIRHEQVQKSQTQQARSSDTVKSTDHTRVPAWGRMQPLLTTHDFPRGAECSPF